MMIIIIKSLVTLLLVLVSPVFPIFLLQLISPHPIQGSSVLNYLIEGGSSDWFVNASMLVTFLIYYFFVSLAINVILAYFKKR